MAPTTSSARVAVSVRLHVIVSARASGLGAERWRSSGCDGAVWVRDRCLAKVITHALVVRGDHLQTPIFGLTPPPIVDVAWDLDHRLFQHRPQGLCRGEAARRFLPAISGTRHRLPTLSVSRRRTSVPALGMTPGMTDLRAWGEAGGTLPARPVTWSCACGVCQDAVAGPRGQSRSRCHPPPA
jgi:hypothetical protein